MIAVVGVLAARAVLDAPALRDFFSRYPGTTERPEAAPYGFPAWLQWQHFLNAFLLVFIVKSGLQIRAKQRPPAFVTRRNTGLITTKHPPRRLSLHVWWHLVIDTLWVLNGVIYFVLLFASGQWLRLVPLTWDVIPNAISAGIQYAAFQWPLHDGWVHYNALQQLFYAATVFIAGPLALVTGLRLSPVFTQRDSWFTRRFTEAVARRLHWAIMIYFLAFTVVHVTLVLTTGALRNLNAMYAGRHDESWIGLAVFAVSLVVMVLGWFVARPALLTRLAERGNDVRRMK